MPKRVSPDTTIWRWGPAPAISLKHTLRHSHSTWEPQLGPAAATMPELETNPESDGDCDPHIKFRASQQAQKYGADHGYSTRQGVSKTAHLT